MEHALRRGIHYCAIGEQLIFLDVDADRYFALGDRAATAFSRLATGGDIDNYDLDRLLRTKLIEPRRGGTLAPCAAPPLPQRSTLDEVKARPSMWRRAAALAALNTVGLELRESGLASTIAALQRLKLNGFEPRTRSLDLHREVAAFEWTSRWARSHDQCLSRSLALAKRLIRIGVDVDVIIGVRLRPFAAHCWVQTGQTILNDRFEQVRSYQPILVV